MSETCCNVILLEPLYRHHDLSVLPTVNLTITPSKVPSCVPSYGPSGVPSSILALNRRHAHLPWHQS